jgi:hypothetical protein
VEVHPEAEWDARIAWLHTFYDGGQVSGLLLAAWVSQTDVRLSLPPLAGGMVAAAVLGWWTTPTPPAPLRPRPVFRYAVQHVDWTLGTPQRLSHYLSWQAARCLGTVVQTPFGLFLTTWLLSLIGSSAFFALYPVLMQEVFGMAAWLASSAFALAVGVRLLAFVLVFNLGYATVDSQQSLAVVGVTLVVLAWSLLSVSSTALTAHLSPVGEGAGMGMLHAATAIAGMTGALVGDWLAAH